MAEDAKQKTLLTPPFRISFPCLFKPNSMSGKFGVVALFPKGADFSNLKKEMARVVKEMWPDGKPNKLKTPFLDGDAEEDGGYKKEDEAYRNAFYVHLNSTYQPGVLKANKDEVLDQREVIPGYWARASINVYAWNYADPKTGKVVKRGASFGLLHVQLLPINHVIEYYKDQKTDYPLVEESFRKFKVTKAAEDFDAVDDPSDEPGQYVQDDDDDWM